MAMRTQDILAGNYEGPQVNQMSWREGGPMPQSTPVPQRGYYGAPMPGSPDARAMQQQQPGMYQNLEGRAPTGQTQQGMYQNLERGGIGGALEKKEGTPEAQPVDPNNPNYEGGWPFPNWPTPNQFANEAANVFNNPIVANANEKGINDQINNLNAVQGGFNASTLPGLGDGVNAFNSASNTAARTNTIRDLMGASYDPNKSLAENYSQIDRNANPELYGAAARVAGQQGTSLSTQQAPGSPDLLTPNWADQNAYGLANRDQLATSQWNRFDHGADNIRNRNMAYLNQDAGQVTDPGTKDLNYKNWATDVINDQVWNAKGVNMATGDLNQIFNYSPEADRAREILGRRLSDGGGENLAWAYGRAQNLNEKGTSADAETAARDKLLQDMSRANTVSAGGVNLKVDDVGALSDRQARDATQGAREGFNDRGRVRGSGAVVAELMANEGMRAQNRQERNQNYLNQANVGLANQQNQLQASIEQGRQNLSRMGQANQVLGDRFNQRQQADDTINQRKMEAINAMAGTDAQRQQNFMQGYGANMDFDADYQNRVDRYLGAEMDQGAYNTGQTNNWLAQLGGVDDRYQGIQRENNALAAQRAQFGNDARMTNAQFGNDARMNQESLYGQRLGEQMSASDNWNNRLATDDAAARARMNDYQGISSDWQGRQQQNFQNEYDRFNTWQQNQQQDFLNQAGLNQAGYNAYAALRNDPYGALSGVQGGQLDPMQVLALQQGIGDADRVSYLDSLNMTNSLGNAVMGYNMQNKMSGREATSNLWGGAMELGAKALEAYAMSGCWWARGVYGEDNPKWLVFRDWLLNKAPDKFREWYFKTGPVHAAEQTKNPEVVAFIKPIMDRIVEQHMGGQSHAWN